MDTMVFMTYQIWNCLALCAISPFQLYFVLYFCFPDSCFIDFSDSLRCTVPRFPVIMHNTNTLQKINTQIEVFVVDTLVQVLIKFKIFTGAPNQFLLE